MPTLVIFGSGPNNASDLLSLHDFAFLALFFSRNQGWRRTLHCTHSYAVSFMMLADRRQHIHFAARKVL